MSTKIAVIKKIAITRRGKQVLGDVTKTIGGSAGLLDGKDGSRKTAKLLLLLFALDRSSKLPEVDNRRSIHIRFAQPSTRDCSCCTR
jgi:hypothetical protein